MPTDTPMQLGMIGLGRMGANLVHGLCAPACTVTPVSAMSRRELAINAGRASAEASDSDTSLNVMPSTLCR